MSLMNGTTRCPHCETRFKIAEAQLAAHHGMVRCGHCLQAFDARPDFIPDQPDPQLELPIGMDLAHDEELAVREHTEPAAPAVHETLELTVPFEEPEGTADETESAKHDTILPLPAESSADSNHLHAQQVNTLDFSLIATTLPDSEHAAETEDAAFTVAIHAEEKYYEKQLAPDEHVMQDTFHETTPAKQSNWPWVAGILMAVLLLTVQSVYFFRTSLAAHLPVAKPALIEFCQLLDCSVPLPQRTELMSIESSSLDADPAHENQVTLNALLRNRASYNMAFPELALTLNDSQDKPLARRILLPTDYLPADETEKTGFPNNHEVNIKLPLYTGELRPVGYRLELFYKQK